MTPISVFMGVAVPVMVELISQLVPQSGTFPHESQDYPPASVKDKEERADGMLKQAFAECGIPESLQDEKLKQSWRVLGGL
jgi:hypothetical protein